MNDDGHDRELERLANAYERRSKDAAQSAWTALLRAERERHYRRALESVGAGSLHDLDLVELGCGGGAELQRMIALGLDPARLVGVELLPERAESARRSLPSATRIQQGDATRTGLPTAGFDVVFLSTVFTSILDDAVQERFAAEAWRLVRPGGIVLWYDFVVDNPRNPDVRGVPTARIRELFPDAIATFQTTTLAPPIGRSVARLGMPGRVLHRTLSALPFLRTHVVATLRRPLADRDPPA